MEKQRIGLLWLRVSEDKGQDLTGQERELRGLAARHGLLVPDQYVFRIEGESAFTGDPPQKAQVLELARRAKFDVLLVWSLDRWSRNRKRGAAEVFDLLPRLRVTVLSHEEPYLSTETVPEIMREVLGKFALWMAEGESERKSRRVQVRYETNRNRAEGGGGRAKWGRGRIPSKADEARVCELAKAKRSIRAIANETGIPKSTVGDILRRLSERSLREGVSV
jgi:DNA invertase Pin-like site-specific DNA recombinase